MLLDLFITLMFNEILIEYKPMTNRFIECALLLLLGIQMVKSSSSESGRSRWHRLHTSSQPWPIEVRSRHTNSHTGWLSIVQWPVVENYFEMLFFSHVALVNMFFFFSNTFLHIHSIEHIYRKLLGTNTLCSAVGFLTAATFLWACRLSRPALCWVRVQQVWIGNFCTVHCCCQNLLNAVFTKCRLVELGKVFETVFHLRVSHIIFIMKPDFRS